MNKLVVCIMGQNCERFIKMCLESVKDADAIVYCDGGSTDKTIEIVEEFDDRNPSHYEDPIPMANPQPYQDYYFEPVSKTFIIKNPYDQEDLGMNGKQRNFYLNYLKVKYPNDWALVLDADEVVEDLSKIKDFIQNAVDGLYSVTMRHLIGDLAHEDATIDKHWVPNRLFKIKSGLYYPEVEHPVLFGDATYLSQTDCTTIWHLAYIPNLWEIKKRYDNHMKKSNIHNPQFLKQWYFWHLFGSYPKKEFNPVEIPKIILDEFGVNKDELYFSNRGVDFKHPLMVRQWYEYFKPESVLDLACGRGPYLYFWNWFVEDIQGIDISQYAVDNSFIPNRIIQGDVTDEGCYKEVDLITVIDILEHLDDEQLDKALNNIRKFGKKFVFSIPFIGDSNLLNDKTHKQFHEKQWWIEKINSFGIKISEPPSNWLFAPQILIGQ